MPNPTGHLLKELRSVMKTDSQQIQAYLITGQDQHQSEYIAPCDERLQFITGCDARKGTAVILQDKAAVWVDGRYTVAAKEQLDSHWTPIFEALPGAPGLEDWLVEHLPAGSRIGVDPLLIKFERFKILAKDLAFDDLFLVPVESDLIDQVWGHHNKPPQQNNKLFIMDFSYSDGYNKAVEVVVEEENSGVMETCGSLDFKSWQDKVRDVKKSLAKKRATTLIVTSLDEVAWLFNLRGYDIVHNPVFYAYAIVTRNSVSLFIDQDKIDDEVRQHLCLDQEDGDIPVNVRPYKDLQRAVEELSRTERKIWISPSASAAVGLLVPEDRLHMDSTPLFHFKSVKNSVEIEGTRHAHIRDAVASCEFFAWLEREVPKGGVTEHSAANKLEEYCSEQKDYISLSFDTISAVGAHATQPNFKTHEIDSAPVTCNELYFCASGRHFKDGTTNITRVVHYGTPRDRERECYTRVLKGHIAVARTVFPNGVKGHHLDAISRKWLWNSGMDFHVYTGHGVGFVTHVVEWGYGIDYMTSPHDLPLEAGMTLTIEPAFYEEGKFGIRLENLFVVKPVYLEHNYDNVGYLGFDIVSFLPFQKKMLMMSLLEKEEIDWLNDYHKQCVEKVAPALREQGREQALQWLLKETTPL